MDKKIVQRFMERFEGMRTAYGMYTITGKKSSGKLVGDAKSIDTVRGDITFQLWNDHLEGRQGLGIVPINEESNCRFGAMDIDIYDGLPHEAIVARLKANGIPLVVCRSKSGGAHGYLFCKEFIPAPTMVARLREIAAFLGHGGCEIFPKQEQILAERGDMGQWINVPYFNGTKGLRYAIKEGGDAMSPEEFLDYADKMAVGASYFDEQFDFTMDLEGGPPCLGTLIQLGFPDGTRNNALYNIGVYLKKAFPDEWEGKIDEANQMYMKPPLGHTEVQGVVKSLRKKAYRYKCDDQPINSHCNKPLCRTKKFGVSDGSLSMPSFGTLTKLDVDPVIWFWDIDGNRVEVNTEALQSPALFQRACMETLNIMIPAIPRQGWQELLQQAFNNLVVIEGTPDGTPEGLFMEILESYCTTRAVGSKIEELLLGKAVVTNGRAYFRVPSLLQYMEQKKFREFKANKVCAILRKRGAKHHFDQIKGKPTNYWSVPEFAKVTESLEVPEDDSMENAF